MEGIWWGDGEGHLLASRKSLQTDYIGHAVLTLLCCAAANLDREYSRMVEGVVTIICLEALQVQGTFFFCPVFREFEYLVGYLQYLLGSYSWVMGGWTGGLDGFLLYCYPCTQDVLFPKSFGFDISTSEWDHRKCLERGGKVEMWLDDISIYPIGAKGSLVTTTPWLATIYCGV